jgi:N6-L-threonylcarbamoyladenine synthase
MFRLPISAKSITTNIFERRLLPSILFGARWNLPPGAASRSCRLTTLAIETSCDDTSVAVLSTSNTVYQGSSRVLFHEKITSNSAGYGGIHPLIALHSHQEHLALLVRKAILCLETFKNGSKHSLPLDFVSVTRGPGMRSNLSVGLDTAKGLALAWNVPLVGVHHMQAHALTPRLCSSLSFDGVRQDQDAIEPWFPFLTILASGGHTMLLESRSLVDHTILAETSDIAIGDCLDKAARAILPPELLIAPYGRALTDFAFPDPKICPSYKPPARRQDELERRKTRWDWAFNPPLSESKAGGGKSSRRMIYSFGGISTYAEQLMSQNPARSIDERRDMAREVLRVAFEHLASRIFLHLASLPSPEAEKINTMVISGGVASNTFLRHVVRSTLNIRGFTHVRLEFPPVELCTDNALMIAWAGMEMFNAGYQSELTIGPHRKWSMDSAAEDGGILGVGGWTTRPSR